MEVYERNSSIRGYHVYKDIWDTVIGEDSNVRDSRIMAVIDMQLLLRKMKFLSVTCCVNISSLFPFLRRGNEITCFVTGYRRYSADLQQGGLEVPCVLQFEGETKEIAKLKRFVKPKTINIHQQH